MNQSEYEASIAWSKIVTGCVIKRDDGKYLLVQERYHKIYGLWGLPSGHVDAGESIETAAVREVKEETGYFVELSDKIDVYHETVESSVRHAFRANIVKGKLKFPPEEILDADWFSFDEITRMKQEGKLRADWIFDAVSRVESSSIKDFGDQIEG